MSARTLSRQRRSLALLVTVSVAAMAFAILLVLVRLQWSPLESVDHGAAARINHLVAGDHALVTVVKAVTWLGSGGVLWTVIGAAAAGLAIQRRWRLAIYLLVTGAGALVLDPILKSLVGRLRPVVAHPVAHGTGNSFPRGHSLGSIACYGAVKSRLIGAITEVEAIGCPRCPWMNPSTPSTRCNCGTYRFRYIRSIDSTSNST